jgi:hypothetical protein
MSTFADAREVHLKLRNLMLISVSETDQASPEANSCRSTYSIQGYRCYW